MFEIGQQVICIDDNPNSFINIYKVNLEFTGDLDGLQKGLIYTIRNIVQDTNIHFYKDPVDSWGLQLEEIIRPPAYNGGPERAFSQKRFRPVKKTNIDVFTEILKSVEVKEDA